METIERIKIYFLLVTSILLMTMALLSTSGCVVMTKKNFNDLQYQARIVGQLEGIVKACDMHAKRVIPENNINEEPYE